MSLEFLTWGGQLLQAEVMGGPLFYRSPWPGRPGTAWRGGVPVIFPQFADHGPLAKHGFARNLPWRLCRDTATQVEADCVLRAGERADWPHAVALHLRVTCDETTFVQTLTVHNTGASGFAFTGGLHPYWAVEDLADTRVTGVPVSGLGNVAIDTWVAGGGEVVLTTARRTLTLTQSGFEGWQVWTPGPSHALRDLPEADWQRFLCLEPMMMTPRWLAPGTHWVGELRASVRLFDEQKL